MAEISLKDSLHQEEELKPKTIQLDIKYTFFQQFINFICQQTPLSARKITNKRVTPRNYQKNHINTKKFTLFDFIPKFLMHELQISINIVYIFFVIFNFIFQLDGSGIINFYSLHLITSLTLSFLRELYFFMRSAYSDYQFNSQRITKINKYGKRFVKRCNVQVGDIIELNQNQLAPADLLILKNNNEDNLLWVKTDQLDGNLNSQLKDPIKCVDDVYNFEEFFEKKYEFMIEKPNAEINKFNGEVSFDSQHQNLTVENCVWKNCYLTSGNIYGLVIYTGKETKSSFWQKQKIHKIAKIDTKLTYIYIIQLICFAIVSLMGVFVFKKPVNNFFKNLNANFVYFGIFISIAPKIMLDWTRFVLAVRMNKINKKENLIVNNIEIIESIGSIDTMLIDKTGTLTKNNFNLNKLYSLVQERNLKNNHFTFENEMQKLFQKIKKQQQLTEDERIDFMQILGSLLCTEIYTKHMQDGNIVYNGVSQEEIAIVNYLKQFGIILKKRCKKIIEIEFPFDQIYKFQILKLYPLKKLQTYMGIIVKCLTTEKKYLFIKGNEDAIVSRINNKQEQNWLIDNMKFMRKEGLRPLSLIYKEIKTINNIKFENDDYKILTIFGVEDRFQYKVQESLYNLKKANIKTYLVTGDEIETIKSITNSIKFKEKQKQFFVLNDNELYHLELKLEHYNERVHLMIVTGQAFEIILQANHLKQMFLNKIQNSFDVCFCKFSATQKETLCKLLKNQGQSVCAVGDGSNDIPMILQSNVGIGISGEQGSEASQQADFSIKQFSDLQNLVLHKGRNYNMIVSKNVTFAHWSLVYAGFSLWFFNLYTGIGFYQLFTNFCLFMCTYFYGFGNMNIVFRFEDMSLIDVLDYPNIYIYSQQGRYLNLKVILKWLFKMIFQNLVIHTLLFWYNFSLNERRFILFTVMMIEGFFVEVPSLFSFRKALRYFIFDISFLLIVMMTLKNVLYFGHMKIELLSIALMLNLASNLPFLLLKIYQDYIRPSNERKIILECQKRKKIRQKNEKFTVQDF